LFITHEHTDHTAALCLRRPFAARYAIPVYGEPVFWSEWDARQSGELPLWLRNPIKAGETVAVGDLSVSAIGKPHDTRSSVGYLISDGRESVAVLTDLGHVPATVAQAVNGADYLIMESNHDVEMERTSGRPWPLVQRELGDRGHLSNEQSLQALCRIAGPSTRLVLLAHLSLECNRPELARRVVGDGLVCAGHRCAVEVAPADGPTDWFPR
jgi:phosphoribosyl 1,2-cyclic phosphodiesterase